LASFLSGCKKTISFKFAQPVVECAPYAAPEGVDPPVERIVFPAAAYTEHLQFCNSMMDVPTRQAQVEEATKEYGPAAKKRKAEDAGVAAEEGDLEELEEDDILEMDMSHVAI
jgi:hypothetical protein